MKTPVLAALVMAALFSGCGYKMQVVNYAAEANDTALNDAEWVICKGASIGSVVRKYGNNPDVWKAICSQETTFEPRD